MKSNNLLIIFTLLTLSLTACDPSSRYKDKPNSNNPPQNETTTANSTLKVGDLIFHKSQSAQSKAIFEASGSEWSHVGLLVSKNNKWYVAEAIGPVVFTPLEDFINRGKNKEYKIYRFKHFSADSMTEKLIEAIKIQNKAYDIYFEFSDEKTYCSELVYKSMLDVTGHEIGLVQQFKDLKLDGPYVKSMIKKRLTDKGRILNPDEYIVTPISQMNDPNLILIKESLAPEESQ